MITEKVTVKSTVNAPVDIVWKHWTSPEHIVKWNSASPDWHSPAAKNDVRVGGKFNIRMEAKDKSQGFDFEGIYDKVEVNKFLSYTKADGRRVEVKFTEKNGETEIEESFDAEQTNSVDMQRSGWQAILDNFKKYVEVKK